MSPSSGSQLGMYAACLEAGFACLCGESSHRPALFGEGVTEDVGGQYGGE